MRKYIVRNNEQSAARKKFRLLSGKQKALKGFFKPGENYVTLLSKKEKILARLLEDGNKKS